MTNDKDYHTEGVGEYVLELFGDYKGTCVDVGAYHSRWLSNSYLLEKNGWTVFCIEPNPHCMEMLKERSWVYDFAIGSENKDNIDFYIYNAGHGPDGTAGVTGLIKHKGLPVMRQNVKVKLRTLDWFLENCAQIDNLDFLSIDVEGTEMQVLYGVDLDRWQIKVISIENVNNNPDQFEYLTSRGFTKTERFMFNDIYER
jgi:FkbM family methyltransferase